MPIATAYTIQSTVNSATVEPENVNGSSLILVGVAPSSAHCCVASSTAGTMKPARDTAQIISDLRIRGITMSF